MTKINKNFQKLITLMKNKGVDYYLVGTTDEFLNEYVPDYNMRLKWLTNFSGSNGYALVSKLKKHFFTDGRYILQAKKELSSDYIIHDISKENLVEFLNKN